MCEFKVLVEGEKRAVAVDVVKAKYEGGKLLLVDVLGSATPVEGAMVSELDVGREELVLLKHPLLAPVIEFVHEYLKCESIGLYDSRLDELWERVKSEGETALERLKKTCRA